MSRWQFVITVMFHMTFPAITVGLSILLSVLYGMYWKTHKAGSRSASWPASSSPSRWG